MTTQKASTLWQPAQQCTIVQVMNDKPTLTGQPGVSLQHPEYVGPYRIIDVLGEGGLAVVYLAEQREPVQRRVAVKMIKPGMDSRQVVTRFESERQALAVMDHQNIAKVYDAGVTDAGRPYFVMEHVPGVRLTTYCDTHTLSTADRVRLMMEVCSAIQHAHQKGVIHRDVKPSNILVAERDGKPQVKVIDFGIAKALGPSLTGADAVTRLGQFVGTPRYMSPEQADGSGLDVDTRTDVYSLGVVLYELLTSVPPIDLDGVPDHAVRYALRDKEPVTPSHRLHTLGQALPAVAKARHADPTTLERTLRGDLDWVVMKAMHKDRAQRYDTVAALGADLERFLEQRPVVARPPSGWYVMSRFVRRNRAAVVAGAVAALAILAGAALVTAALVRAQRAEQQVRVEAETSRQVSDFLVGLFKVSEPGEAAGTTVTAKDILDSGAERIGSDLSDQPEVRATLMATMGQVYQQLGLYPQSEALLRDALDANRELHGDESLPVAQARNRLGLVLSDSGDYESAEALLRQSLAVRESEAEPDQAAIAQNLADLGWVLYENGQYDEAVAVYERTLDLHRQQFGDDSLQTASVMNRFAVLRRATGDTTEAEPLLRGALAIYRRELGSESLEVARMLNNLGSLLYERGDYADAEPAYREALALRQSLLGKHANVATTMNNLALLLRARGDYAGAEAMYDQVLELRRDLLGEQHPAIGGTLNDLGVLYHDLGDYPKAIERLQQARQLFDDALGADHPNSAVIRTNLADSLYASGSYVWARDLATEAVTTLENRLPAGHWRTAVARSVLGAALAGTGDLAAAQPLVADSMEPIRSAKGEDAPYTRSAVQRLQFFCTRAASAGYAASETCGD
ncbi:MAG: serine/threonine-protein kinase [Pseudomonadota bacterium]